MQAVIKSLVLAAGMSLGLAAGPLAHSDGEEMTVKMNTNFVTADPETIKWAPNKSAPYGMQVVVLYGDPAKPGPYVFRAKMPSGYKIPPHKHPDERNVTVLKGTYWSGVGERYNPMVMKEFQAGAFYITKANVPHFAWARTEVIIQEMGEGGQDHVIEYVNPDDDPRKQ
ncbi:MAG TPA: cupin domain-containing protein [Burkholderiales bacterium]|jgi:quercetin dioxygenase-like cupin family protein|nr:cupin domain-containing protein [Burkholderiales bacterium]